MVLSQIGAPLFPTRGTSDDNPHAVYIRLAWLRGMVLAPGARGSREQPRRTCVTAAGAKDSVDVEMGTERAWWFGHETDAGEMSGDAVQSELRSTAHGDSWQKGLLASLACSQLSASFLQLQCG